MNINDNQVTVVSYEGAQALLASSAAPYFYQFVGPLVAIEAIWAHLVSKEVRRTGRPMIEGIRLEYGVPYRRRIKKMISGVFEMVIAHPATLATWTGGNFLLVSTFPGYQEAFFNRLSMNLKLPLRKEWSAKLWTKGLECKNAENPTAHRPSVRHICPIEKVPSTGLVHLWAVRTIGIYFDAWHQIVKEILGENCGKHRS